MSVITFNEDINGWSSFHTYSPEGLEGLFGNFYSFKNGQLFLHNSEDVNRNTFYGQPSPSKISFVINDEPNDRKILNTLVLQGSDPWQALIKAYIDNTGNNITSTIDSAEFKQKEGVWYAHTRRGSAGTGLSSNASYGIGQIKEINASNVKLDYIPNHLSEGDEVLKFDGVNTITIGTIEQVTGNFIRLSSVAGLEVSNFLMGYKNPRDEGDRLRGYAMSVDLENSNYSKDIELFSVDYEVIKSFM